MLPTGLCWITCLIRRTSTSSPWAGQEPASSDRRVHDQDELISHCPLGRVQSARAAQTANLRWYEPLDHLPSAFLPTKRLRHLDWGRIRLMRRVGPDAQLLLIPHPNSGSSIRATPFVRISGITARSTVA